jgi:hypothetical protein
VATIREEWTALDGEFHEERVEGASLALRRAEQNVAMYIGPRLRAADAAHAPRCHKPWPAINRAVEDFLAAVQEHGGIFA